MSCYDWNRLLEHRFEPSAPEPADWPAAEEHLDGCESCRALAVSIDPTLAFRALCAPALDTAEIEAVKRSVEQLRRGRALERCGAARRRSFRWRTAAVAVLALGLGFVSSGGFEPAPLEAPRAAASPRPAEAEPAGSAWVEAPVVEEVQNPGARVYQYAAWERGEAAAQEKVDIAWVIDPSLDV